MRRPTMGTRPIVASRNRRESRCSGGQASRWAGRGAERAVDTARMAVSCGVMRRRCPHVGTSASGTTRQDARRGSPFASRRRARALPGPACRSAASPTRVVNLSAPIGRSVDAGTDGPVAPCFAPDDELMRHAPTYAYRATGRRDTGRLHRRGHHGSARGPARRTPPAPALASPTRAPPRASRRGRGSVSAAWARCPRSAHRSVSAWLVAAYAARGQQGGGRFAGGVSTVSVRDAGEGQASDCRWQVHHRDIARRSPECSRLCPDGTRCPRVEQESNLPVEPKERASAQCMWTHAEQVNERTGKRRRGSVLRALGCRRERASPPVPRVRVGEQPDGVPPLAHRSNVFSQGLTQQDPGLPCRSCQPSCLTAQRVSAPGRGPVARAPDPGAVLRSEPTRRPLVAVAHRRWQASHRRHGMSKRWRWATRETLHGDTAQGPAAAVSPRAAVAVPQRYKAGDVAHHVVRLPPVAPGHRRTSTAPQRRSYRHPRRAARRDAVADQGESSRPTGSPRVPVPERR